MTRSTVELGRSIAAPVVWGTSEKGIFYISWRTGLPTLSGSMTTLRELRLSDAPALFESLTMDAVARFISPPSFSDPLARAGIRQRRMGLRNRF